MLESFVQNSINNFNEIDIKWFFRKPNLFLVGESINQTNDVIKIQNNNEFYTLKLLINSYNNRKEEEEENTNVKKMSKKWQTKRHKVKKLNENNLLPVITKYHLY